MKCPVCHREWSAANSGVVCPFCQQNCAWTQQEIDRAKSEAIMALSNKKYEDAAALMHDVAEQGDPQAQYLYADILLEGKGVKESAPKARVFLLMAARQGYHRASLKLSDVLKKMALPASSSRFWLRMAAAQGNPEAAHRLGKSYEKGIDTEPSLPLALYWYMQSSAGGYEDATVELVRYYIEDGTELSRAHARFLLEKVRGHRILSTIYQAKLGKGERIAPKLDRGPAGNELCALGVEAEQNGEDILAVSLYRMGDAMSHAECSYRLGVCLEEGTGAERDVTAAASCYKRSAEAGYSPAMTRLGLLLRNTSSENVSSSVALSWIQKAARAGEPEAEYALGCAYMGGTLTKRNLLYAREWFGKAADHGHEDAKKRAEELDETMEELVVRAKEAWDKRDQKEAFRLYLMAAEMGHNDARCYAAICLQNGIGTKKDGAAAVKYYKLAASDGSTAAVFKLGECYFKGDGVPCNYRIARVLLTEAQKEGYEEATAMIATMGERKKKKEARRLYAISTVLYHKGKVDEAIAMRALAATAGSGQAMFLLGCHYEFGDELPYDHDAAENWFRKAVANGFHVGAARLKNGFVRARRRRTERKK